MDPASKQAAKYKTQSILGIINDKVEVGMAKIRGEDSAALDVAIIKATLQDEVVPKEKHVRTLKIACTASSPRQTVNYVIHGLAKRLEENAKAWLVTLKTLIVFHRLMRETDPSFQEELLRYAERTGHHRMLRLESFADHTTKETWDLSAWIRVYSLYLDERLAVFRAMRFDPEQDHGLEARESKLKSCSAAELLEHLPAVQRLLGRLVCCVPEGAAQSHEIALLACSLVLKEVRCVYKVVCEGVLNLVDRIFEMDRGDALKGVELVKENLSVNERLNAFVSTIGAIPPLRGAVQFPNVQPLPSDFLTTLEDYIKDVPKNTGDAGRTNASRASTMQRGPTGGPSQGSTGPRLIVGGPIKDPPSGPSSPEQSLAAPAPAPQVDLLGFESFNIGSPGAAAAAPPKVPTPAAVVAPAQGPPHTVSPAAAQTPFDPFAGFASIAAPPLSSDPALAVQQRPPPTGTFTGRSSPRPGQISSFANPTAAVAATGGVYSPGAGAPPQAGPILPPQPPAGPATGAYHDTLFAGGAGAYGLSAVPQPEAPPVAPPPRPPASSFNPFANPAMHVAMAPHMPTPTPAATFPQAGMPPAPPMAAYAPPPMGGAPPAPAPQTPASAQTPSQATNAQPQQPIAFANPFGSPNVTSPPAPSNPFGSPGAGAGGGPSPSNPFGAVVPGSSNPFVATTAWPGAAIQQQAVVTQQVGGYNLKKPADPLMDLSMDLFGKPQVPPTQQPMRPLGVPQNGGGSPGALL